MPRMSVAIRSSRASLLGASAWVERVREAMLSMQGKVGKYRSGELRLARRRPNLSTWSRRSDSACSAWSKTSLAPAILTAAPRPMSLDFRLAQPPAQNISWFDLRPSDQSQVLLSVELLLTSAPHHSPSPLSVPLTALDRPNRCLAADPFSIRSPASFRPPDHPPVTVAHSGLVGLSMILFDWYTTRRLLSTVVRSSTLGLHLTRPNCFLPNFLESPPLQTATLACFAPASW